MNDWIHTHDLETRKQFEKHFKGNEVGDDGDVHIEEDSSEEDDDEEKEEKVNPTVSDLSKTTYVTFHFVWFPSSLS